MSYFTQVHREITELTSLTLSVSLTMLSDILFDFSLFFCLIIFCLSVLLFLILVSSIPSVWLSLSVVPPFLLILFSKQTDLNKLPGLE